MGPLAVVGIVVVAVVVAVGVTYLVMKPGQAQTTDSGGRSRSASSVQNRSKAHDDARRYKRQQELYSIPSRRKGHFILFNMHKFDDGEERKGSDKDAQRLENLSKDLGFEFYDYHNLTKSEIYRQLQRIVDVQFDRYSCLAIAILSHGSGCGFISADREFIRTESVLNFFSNENCPALKGKPKLVFIQACQTSDIPDTRDTHAGLLIDVKREIDLDTKVIDMKPDFFLAVATTLGHVAYRCPKSGSYFIQSLDRILRKFADTEEIHMLLLKVRKDVQATVNQIPVVKSTLMKELYLNPPW